MSVNTQSTPSPAPVPPYTISTPHGWNIQEIHANDTIQDHHVLSADHLVLVVLAGKDLQRWLNDASTQPHDEVQSRIWINNRTLSILDPCLIMCCSVTHAFFQDT